MIEMDRKRMKKKSGSERKKVEGSEKGMGARDRNMMCVQ